MFTPGFIRQFYLFHFAGSKLKTAWCLLNPLFLSMIIGIIFFKIFKPESPLIILTILSGYLPWQFSASTLQSAHRLYLDQRAIAKQLKNTKLSFLFNFILFRFLLFLPGMFLCSLSCWILSPHSIFKIPLYALILVLIFLFIFSLACFLSIYTLYYPDISHGLETLFSFLIWLTPVFYGLEDLPRSLQHFLLLNPATWFLDALRASFEIRHEFPLGLSLPILIILTLIAVINALIFFKKHEKEAFKQL